MNEERIDAIPTRWSLIRHADDSTKPETIAELRRLLTLRYSAAIRRYIGAMVKDRDDADELAQDVLMRLMRGDFAGADPARGRFRDLLKTAIRNMVRNYWDKTSRRKTADTDLTLVQDQSEELQDQAWTAAWQKSIIDHTWARMKLEDAKESETGQESVYSILLKLRVTSPDATSEELAELLSQKMGNTIKPDNCRQMLRRARKRFAAHLIDEVKSGLDSESDERLQEELAALNLLHWVGDLA